MSDEILVDKKDAIATLTINRPARRNALSGAVVRELTRQFGLLSQDATVGVIVLTGAGEKAFCAGADLMDAQAEAAGGKGILGMHEARADFADLLLAMNRCARPIIGRANGHALGGGLGLLLSCDLTVGKVGATFGTPEVKVGLFPMMIMAVISRNLGRKRAMEMMLTGERLSAEEAVEYGILNRAVAPEKLNETVEALASRIAGFSPAVLKLGRRAFYKTQDMTFEQALATLQNELTINTLTDDATEGIMAFLGKRDPEWTGR
ncbi:crotonase [Bradymonas sediminis]|uniref:Crotonase n=2 Tax=Bradymonas sediminis TaxID=1548548 RepID=A0A2Z4FR33_9DELT|nr:crotonase [Bradymonas sediminis]